VVARGLARDTMSRRRALKLVAAGATAALLSMMGAREVEAAKPICRKVGQPCNERHQCYPTTIQGNLYKLECRPLNVQEPGRDERATRVCLEAGLIGPV
jgi:hypothetical protein